MPLLSFPFMVRYSRKTTAQRWKERREKMRKPIVSIGIQDFQSLRERNSFYIDKTAFIREWWESCDDVAAVSTKTFTIPGRLLIF